MNSRHRRALRHGCWLAVCCAVTAAYSTSMIPVPHGKAYLPFQTESIRSLVRSHRILLADEMGLGKTISVIGALNTLATSSRNETLSNVLVLCPKSVIPSWQQELQNWLVKDKEENNSTFWNVEIATARQGLPDISATTASGECCNVLLMNYDIVEKLRDKLDRFWAPFDVVVCDEAHYLKNPSAIRSKAVLGGGGTKGRVKDRRSLDTKRLWLLTGSPLLNNPSELYNILRSIDTECRMIPELRSEEDFSDHYSNRRIAPWGVTYQGGRNLPELRQRLKEKRLDSGTPLMLRRTKSQVLTDLPPKRHQMLPLWDEENKVAANEYNRVHEALQKITTRIEKRGQNSVEKRVPKSGMAKKTVAELKVLLKEHDLRASGTKKELIARLQNHLNETAFDEKDNHEGQHHSDVRNLIDADNLEGIHDSAQSALRSQGRSGPSVLRDVLGLLYREGTTATKSDKDAVRGLLAYARHETARLKIPHAIELIKNSIESHKVVVFAHHRDVQLALREAFAEKAVGIMGDDTSEMRAEAVHRFQTDPSISVFIGSIKAAGTGITLNAASHVIFVEMDWSPLVVQQAEDRCHRVGQRSSVLVQYLFFPDTIDEYLSDLLAAKQSTITSAIDEATGAAGWVFDFGQYDGTSVADVAGSDPSYLQWLAKSNTIGRGNPKLTAALKELGFLPKDEADNDKGDIAADNGDDAVVSSLALDENLKSYDEITEGPATWEFSFGKHSGKRVVDVAKSAPQYLIWLVKNYVYDGRPELKLALESLGFLNERSSTAAEVPQSGGDVARDATPKRKGLQEEPGSYVMTFGKHKGKRLEDIPRKYLEWLSSAGAIRKHPMLMIHLEKHLAERAQLY